MGYKRLAIPGGEELTSFYLTPGEKGQRGSPINRPAVFPFHSPLRHATVCRSFFIYLLETLNPWRE
jgi:hypothetical protein